MHVPKRDTLEPARCKVKKVSTLVRILLLATIWTIAGPQAQWKTHWTYEGLTGVDHWGDLDPEYAACKTGREQSPIDIRNAVKAQLPPLHFQYRNEGLKYLINNGYTIRVNYYDGPQQGNFLTVGGKRYQLTQFHFHRPSEEYVQGKPYEMEVHFMHQAADGEAAGVVTFLKAGGANATIAQIWAHMPQVEGKEHEVPGVEINPAGLLPPDKAYYLYRGSLTAPPCTEGVVWFVLEAPVEISKQQIEAFAKLYPHDVRPLQPLNGRAVEESQ